MDFGIEIAAEEAVANEISQETVYLDGRMSAEEIQYAREAAK